MTWWPFSNTNKPKCGPPSRDILSPYAAPTIKISKRSRAYNDNWWYRRKTLKLITEGNHFEDPDIESGVEKIAENLCVKFGACVQLSEASALRYVRKMTTIPVPKVYCTFKRRHRTYILMEHIDGEPIGKNWDSRSDTEKESLMAQLKVIFDELHSIQHPRPGVLAAADMQPLYDPRCWKGYLGFGPFAKESEFNNYLRCNMSAGSAFVDEKAVPWVTTEERNEVRRLLDMQQSKQHRICFTHGDANRTNILVKNGKIVALIYFEVSGWYPEYWSVVPALIIKPADFDDNSETNVLTLQSRDREYTTAMDVNSHDEFWKAEIPRFLREYPEELIMETLRKKHFGAFGFRGRMPLI